MKQILSQRRPLELTIHIVSWLLIFGFPLVFVDRGSGMNWHQFLRHSCVPLCYFLIFYINYLWLVPRYLFNDEIRKYIIGNTILILLSSLLLHLLLEKFSTPPPEEFVRRMPPRWIFYIRDVVSMIFVAGLGAAIRTSLRWRQAQEVLYDNQQTFVPLEKELDFIRNYVALMRIRLSPQVKVSLHLATDSGNSLLIAPLLFISLIENAFKHGSGIGLEQVSKRLELIYPRHYEWEKGISANGQVYSSILTIQTKKL